MPITLTANRTAPPDVPVLAVPVFADGEPVDAGAELDAAYLASRRFKGEAGKAEPLMADDGGTVLAIGMGRRADVTADTYRRAGALIADGAAGAETVATTVLTAVPEGVDQRAATQALAEGVLLGSYRFNNYKGEGDAPVLSEVVVVDGATARTQAALDRGARIAEAVNLARDLVNEPAGSVTPTRLAEIATEVGGATGLDVTVWDEVTIENERCGGLRGVSLGSDQPPRLIQLTYEPEGRARGTIALVGKGITFDSGGLSIKTAEGMTTMKTDMAGGAVVIAAMSVLRTLGVKSRVIGIVPATENMPGPRAIKPGDVLKARNGKTIEVLNTDAEGRLVLADGLSLACEARPDAIVDLATLTGAVTIALGKRIAAVMGNSDGFIAQVQSAAERVAEPTWPLPLPDFYKNHLESEVADMKNIGRPMQAGTIIAGLFLREFVDDTPWVHLDIAGAARSDDNDGYIRRGGTGYGVRTIIELVSTFQRPARVK